MVDGTVDPAAAAASVAEEVCGSTKGCANCMFAMPVLGVDAAEEEAAAAAAAEEPLTCTIMGGAAAWYE